MQQISQRWSNYWLMFIFALMLNPVLQPVSAQEEVTVGINIANKLEVALAVGPTSVDYSTFEDDLRAKLAAKNPAVPREDLIITASKAVSANTTSEFTWWVYDHTLSNGTATASSNAASFQGVRPGRIDRDGSGTGTTQFSAGYTYLSFFNYLRQQALLGTGKTWTSANAPTVAELAQYANFVDPYTISDATHRYIQRDAPTNSTSNGTTITNKASPDYNTARHPFNSKVSHMEESNNGATMDFYGYSYKGYRDFRYLPDNQATKKLFEFAIQENVAYDALEGVGFLFNADIQGSYSAGTQTLSGYLLMLRYNTTTGANLGKGLCMTLYKLNKVNTFDLHHNRVGTASASNNIDSQTTSSAVTGGTLFPGVTRIATSTVYGPADVYRRIKLEVMPTYVKVYYAGSPSNSAILTTPIAVDATPVPWTTGPNAQPGQTNSSNIRQLFLDTNVITNYGFGPLGAYLGHECARPTHISLQNLSMVVDKVRSLTEVVREPNWQENTKKFLVNLNEEPIEDFSSKSITAELLARMRNDDVYYIGWCSNANAIASQNFLIKHDLKGTIVNINEKVNYDAQIQAIADKIYERYWRENADNIILVTDKVVLDVSGADATGSADPVWPNGKWKVIHSVDGSGVLSDSFDNDDGIYALSGQYVSDLDLQFNKVGTYDIYHRDHYVKTIIAHKAPVAAFDITLNGAAPTFTDKSYDPDDVTNGIVTSTWSFLNVERDIVPTAGLTFEGLHAALPSLNAGEIYMITLLVTDKYGATTIISKQVRYVLDPNDPSQLVPPFGDFDIAPYTIFKGVAGGQNFILTDRSYDLQGLPTISEFTLYKNDVPIPFDFGVNNNVSSLDAGEYVIKLKVYNGFEYSIPVTRTFVIIEDNIAPTASATPENGNFNTNIQVAFSFSDTGGSGFKEQRVIITNSASLPDSSDPRWTFPSASTSKIVTINTAGTSYIHWEAKDNAGNEGSGSFGPYTLTKKDVTLTLTAHPASSVIYPAPVTLTATLAENDPYPAGSVYFYVNGTILPDAAILTNGVAELIYTHTVTPLPIDNITFSVNYPGDNNYNPANDALTYTINKNATAIVTVGNQQTSKIYDGESFEPTEINVSGTTLYKVEYSGKDGTDYALSTIPPVNTGKYTVTVTTTDPGFIEKTDHADFEIYQRELSLTLSANPDGSATIMSDVILTVTIANAVDLPAGWIRFSSNNVQIGTDVAIVFDGNYKAVLLWPAVPQGVYDLKAEYITAVNDNYIVTEDATISEYTVTKQNQTEFDFTADSPDEKMYGDDNFFVTATGGQTGFSPAYTVTEGSDVISVDPVTGEVTILKAGTAVITATIPGDDNYNPATVTITITVKKRPLTITAKDETIYFGETPVLNYDISDDLINGDELSGALEVDNLDAGTHPITQGTLTAGDNYIITFIGGTLTVIGGEDTEIIDIVVDDRIARRSDNSFHVVADCGRLQAYINVTADPAAKVEINGVAQNPQTVDLPVYGDNTFKITVTAAGNSQSYDLVVVRYYDHVEYEYADVPTINCNTQNNGGYVFTNFQWYSAGTPISGAIRPYCQLKDNATYYCEITLNDGRKWRTCDIQRTLRSTSSLKAYPNPTQGQVTISNDEQLSTGRIQVFDLFGRLVMQPYTNPFDMNALNEGVYIIKMDSETLRVVVKK